ncbi:unnamed protein product [Lampetra fluviatilis]
MIAHKYRQELGAISAGPCRNGETSAHYNWGQKWFYLHERDTRKTVHAHKPGQRDDSAEASPRDSETESEAMPMLQQPPQLPDVPPQSGGGLQDAHFRLAELLLAAASILEEITLAGGAVAGARRENWRQKRRLPQPAPRRNLKLAPFLQRAPRVTGAKRTMWVAESNHRPPRHL